MIEIELPFPERVLKPNSQAHWTAKMDAKQNARDYSKYLSLKFAGRIKRDQKLILIIDFKFADKRKRDLDNALASLKHHLDGIFLGLGLDDSQIYSVHLNKHINHPNPGIMVKLDEWEGYLNG